MKMKKYTFAESDDWTEMHRRKTSNIEVPDYFIYLTVI